MRISTPSLKQVIGLVKIYTPYDNDTMVAERLSWSLKQLTHSWVGESRDWSIPERRLTDFKSLFSEILTREVTETKTKEYLQSDPMLFHMALSPISGKAWVNLIDRHTKFPKLGVYKLVSNLGFGTSDHQHKQLPDAELALNDRFVFKGKIDFSPSEIIIAAEHQNVWHFISYTSSDRILEERGGEFTFPPKIEGKQYSLFEETSPGFYRYFAILMRGGFPKSLHELLHSVNPISQHTLDMIGHVLNSEPDHSIAVLGVTISISEAET